MVMKLLVAVVAVVCQHVLVGALSAGSDPLQGSIFFTSFHEKSVVRLDNCDSGSCSEPVTIANGVEIYGGLRPWNGSLVVGLQSHHVVLLEPWCKDSSCTQTLLVDVDRALGAGQNQSYSVAGMTWCQGSLYIVFGGNSAPTGVLRCAGCEAGQDCTSGCSLVDGGAKPGKGPRELSAFAAGADCLNEQVLIADNQNFRVQALQTSCKKAPCDIKTFASDLKWPLGVSAVADGARVLVTLDEGIVSLGPDGSLQHKDWSSRQDSGFLCEGGGRIFVASGGNGNVASFAATCEGPQCTETLVWNSTGSFHKSVGAIAYMPKPKALKEERVIQVVMT